MFQELPLAITKRNFLKPKRRRQISKNVINSKDAIGNTLLINATLAGDSELVKFLLSNRNIDTEIRNNRGQTAFMIAAAGGHTKILKLLYDDETNIDDADHTQQTALMLALKGNHDQAAKWLLNKSKSLTEIPDASGSYPLHIAASTDKVNMCQELLKKGAYLDRKDDQENTALMIAAEMGSVKAFKFLLKFDPNIEGCNKERRNVLSIATYKRHNPIVDIMMKKFLFIRDDLRMVNDTLAIAAEVDNDEAVDIMFRYTSNSGDSNRGGRALVVATKNTHIKTLKALLKYKAPIDCIEGEETPLCAAAQYSQTRVVQLLLDYNANVNLADPEGLTPLIHATVKEKADIVKMLLKNGAIVDKCNKSGRTPLMFASRKNNPKIVEILLENGANVNHADLEGNTSLIITAKHGNDRALQRLLKEKPNTESQRTDGITALSIAAKKGHAVTVHILLNNHANVNALDVKGRTALHHAVDAGHLDVVRILIENNANIKQVDSNGYSLLMIAKSQQKNDIVKYLLKINASEQFGAGSHIGEKQTYLKNVNHSPNSNVHNREEQTYLKNVHQCPNSNVKAKEIKRPESKTISMVLNRNLDTNVNSSLGEIANNSDIQAIEGYDTGAISGISGNNLSLILDNGVNVEPAIAVSRPNASPLGVVINKYTVRYSGLRGLKTKTVSREVTVFKDSSDVPNSNYSLSTHYHYPPTSSKLLEQPDAKSGLVFNSDFDSDSRLTQLPLHTKFVHHTPDSPSPIFYSTTIILHSQLATHDSNSLTNQSTAISDAISNFQEMRNVTSHIPNSTDKGSNNELNTDPSVKVSTLNTDVRRACGGETPEDNAEIASSIHEIRPNNSKETEKCVQICDTIRNPSPLDIRLAEQNYKVILKGSSENLAFGNIHQAIQSNASCEEITVHNHRRQSTDSTTIYV